MKRKLFLLLCALLTTVGTWAQGTWNAPEVPGVDLSTWDNSAKVYIYNVEADAFVAAGMNWNTNAISTRLTNGDLAASSPHSASVTVTGSTIKMVMDANTGRAVGTNGGDFDCWIDFDHNQDWTFAASAKYTNAYTLVNTAYAGKKLDVAALYGGKLTISNGKGFYDWAFIPVTSITDGSYLKFKEKKAMYGVYQALVSSGKTSTYAEALETANAVYTNASATPAALRAATRALIIAVADGIESRIDATSLFTNADMVGATSTTDWGTSISLSWATFERYHATHTLTQGQTDVPNGLYDVDFHGFYRQDGSDAAPVLTVNNGSSNQSSNVVEMRTMASTWACNTNGNNNWRDQGGNVVPDGQKSAGQGLAYEGTVSSVNDVPVKGNSLTISTTVNSTTQWFIWQGYRIYYKGPVNVALYKQVVEKKGIAEELLPTAPSETSANLLNAAIEEADPLTPNSDEEDLTKAFEDLNAAISFANESGEYYTAFNTLKTAANALVDVPNDNAEANTTLATAISNQTTAIGAATTISGLNAVINTLKTAMITYASIANPVGEGNKFNLTFMMVNPDVTSFASWTPYTNVPGWDSDQADGNRQVMHNDGVACVKGDAFFEYWSETPKANGEFALYNTVEDLPEGTYEINCYALATANGYASATVSKVYFYANDTEGSLISSDVLTSASISFVNNAQQDVKIGLKPMTGNTFRWMGIGYVELYKVPEQVYELNEATAWDHTQSGAGNVEITRTIKVGVNTVVFPFSMNQTEVEGYFGAGSVVYQLSSYDNGTVHFTTKIGISANEPCLVKATSAANSAKAYTLNDRTVVAAASASPSVAGTNVTMTGTYAASTKVAQSNNYIVSDGNLYIVNSDNVYVKNTRAYITLSTPNPEARLVISFDDEDPTAINAIEAEDAEDGALKDGKYLIDGKIVIVKNGVKYSANGQILK